MVHRHLATCGEDRQVPVRQPAEQRDLDLREGDKECHGGEMWWQSGQHERCGDVPWFASIVEGRIIADRASVDAVRMMA